MIPWRFDIGVKLKLRNLFRLLLTVDVIEYRKTLRMFAFPRLTSFSISKSIVNFNLKLKTLNQSNLKGFDFPSYVD